MAGFKIIAKNENDKKMHTIRIAAIYLSLLFLFYTYFAVCKITVEYFKAAFVLVLIVVFSYWMMYISKHRLQRIIIFFVIFAVILGINTEIVSKGIDDCTNFYLKISGAKVSHDKIVGESASIEFLILLLVVAIIFAMILSAVLLAKRLWILPLLIMLMPVFLASSTGYMPDTLCMCGLLVAESIYMICYFMHNTRDTIMALAGAMLFWIALILISMFFVPKVHEYKAIHRERYDEIRNSLKKLETMNIQEMISKTIENRGNYAKGGIGKGKLKNLTNCKPEGSKELEVTLSSPPQSRVYLKAFVGVEYTKEEWKGLGDEAKQELNKIAENNSDLMQIFNEPFDKIQKLSNISKKYLDMETSVVLLSSTANVETMGIHILNRKDDIGYLPYFAEITDSKGLISDLYIEGEGRKDYRYQCYKVNDVDSMMSEYEWYQDSAFLESLEREDPDVFQTEWAMQSEMNKIYQSKTELEENYSKFVSETYKQYPDKLAKLTEFCDKLKTKNYDMTESSVTLAEVIDTEFEKDLRYTLSPGAKPADKDFVEYFLESKKGFCVHFATTSALIYRKFGYPSRYVEGYAIPENKFVEQEDGTYKAVVTDDMAHAWCEVYDETFGWMPREHTKYYNNLDNFVAGDFKEPRQEETKEEITTQQQTTTEPVTKEEVSETEKEKETERTVAQSDHTQNSVNISWKKVLRVVLYIIIIGFIFVVFFFIQCIIRINQKMCKFKSKNVNEGIQCIYNEIVELCQFCGLKVEEKSEAEIFEQIRNSFSQLSDEEWQWINDCTVRAAFSGKESDKKERRKMHILMRKLKKQIWADLSFRKKIIFKFIKAM